MGVTLNEYVLIWDFSVLKSCGSNVRFPKIKEQQIHISWIKALIHRQTVSRTFIKKNHTPPDSSIYWPNFNKLEGNFIGFLKWGQEN